MGKEEFSNQLREQAKKINIELSKKQLEEFYLYMELLKEWNEKINLTAITEERDIITKHFIDSLTINKFIETGSTVIDVGSGAGFPGLPISILRNDIDVVLLDALNKRVTFLKDIISKNNLEKVITIHFRAEEAGKNKEYREKFDIATSRAVASLNVLVEYLLPLVKIGGKCICMKGSNIEKEIEDSKKAIQLLGGEIEKIEEFELPETAIKRSIIIIKKVKNTPIKYPRKAGMPNKEPII